MGEILSEGQLPVLRCSFLDIAMTCARIFTKPLLALRAGISHLDTFRALRYLHNQIWRTKSPRGSLLFTCGKEAAAMSRPAAKDLTERELEVMHTFWRHGAGTAADARDRLAALGLDLAYPTVANLVRILHEKGFVEQTCAERPFRYQPVRTYEEVSGRLLGDLVERVFRGSREQLLVRLVEQRRLTARERTLLEEILKEQP
jgi:predicted transcriptional regulator